MEIDSNTPLFLKSEGDAVIDEYTMCSFLDNVHGVSPKDKFQTLANMSKFVESVVFYERIFVFSFQVDKENDKAYYLSENPLILTSIIEELQKEKILNFVSLLPISFSPPPSKLISQVKEVGLFPDPSLMKINEHNFGYYLYQQEVARRIELPFIGRHSEYAGYFVNNSNKLKYSISEKLVHELDKNLSKELEVLSSLRQDFNFYIPPFLSIIFEKVKKGATFGASLLDLRNQFRPLRKLFEKYNQEINDISKPLGKQLVSAQKITKEIEFIASTFSVQDRTTFSIWSDTFDFLLSSSTDIANFDPIKKVELIPRLSKIANQTLTQLILKRRYSSVYKLRKDFFDIKKYTQLLDEATEPYIREARKNYPNGYICISPGNPFQEP